MMPVAVDSMASTHVTFGSSARASAAVSIRTPSTPFRSACLAMAASLARSSSATATRSFPTGSLPRLLRGNTGKSGVVLRCSIAP